MSIPITDHVGHFRTDFSDSELGSLTPEQHKVLLGIIKLARHVEAIELEARDNEVAVVKAGKALGEAEDKFRASIPAWDHISEVKRMAENARRSALNLPPLPPRKEADGLRVKTSSPRLNVSGDVTVEFGTSGGGSRAFNQGEGPSDGKSPRVKPDDLLAVPTGAKRARVSLNAERAPEIIPLHDESAIEEKGFKGKAAKFYPEAGQLFVNMHYHSVAEMRAQLESEYAHATEPETMRRMAKEFSERTMIIRVGRAVVYALAKQLNQEWTTEDMARAQSPESLSIAADDFVDSLQNVRRRIGIALRAARNEVEETAA
jgi:hypothetical protein